jgi:hypothetical protein
MKQVRNEVQTLKSPPFPTLVCTIASATKFSYHWWQLLMCTLWSMINGRWSYADEIWTFGYIKLHIWKCWSDLFLCYHNIFPFFSCSCSLSLSLKFAAPVYPFIHIYHLWSPFYDFLAFRRWIELFPHPISMLRCNV